MHNDTIQECTQLCRKIKEIINAQDKPSFESIITAEINTACPKLKMTYDTNLRESNIYIAPYIFKTIFKNQPINANELDASGQKLVYGGITTFAQGEKPDMEKLKQVLLELISNNEIKKFIEEYHTLHKELDNKSASFKRELRDLYYSVNGGMTLDKPKDCEICQSF
jgi:hypothetical protein